MPQLAILRKIAPELDELVERRYTVLQNVFFLQPVGRRALAGRLVWPERMVRKEIEFLREVGFLRSDSAGMEVTPTGERMLNSLHDIIRTLHGLSELEQELASRLDLKRVVVVAGDADQDDTVKKELARATARLLNTVLREEDILAVTGGTTLAEVANYLPMHPGGRNLLVVPARGGLGEDVDIQANSVAARIAQRLGGRCRLLHVSDDLGEETMASLAGDPKIKRLLELIREARVVLHGIGPADDMARRRGVPAELIQQLHEAGAVGETMGYYFNRAGEIVYTTSSVGLRLDDLGAADQVIAVGGGHSKAEAALAVLSRHQQDIYITDEGAARAMLMQIKGGNEK